MTIVEVLRLLALACAVLGALVASRHYRKLLADTGGRGVLRSLVVPVAMFLEPRTPLDRELLVTRLQQAGRSARSEVSRFIELRTLCVAIALGISVVLVLAVRDAGALASALILIFAGYHLPGWRLRAEARRRRETIELALPGAVDLLGTCIEASLSIEAAIARVGRELRERCPVLAQEFTMTSSELAAGVPLGEALQRQSRRVGIDDFTALCGVLGQAYALGAPVGAPLRAYAEATRARRLSKLEEEAGRISVKLSMPVALCLLPASLVVILGPAVVQLMGVFE